MPALVYRKCDDLAHILLHEMGRFFLSLGESNTGTWKDVYIWDSFVESLCKNAQSIRAAN